MRRAFARTRRLQHRRRARASSPPGRKRLNLDAEARKALNFVEEFENSGRGWFWETNAEGTLSYVSQQLADDFHCEAARSCSAASSPICFRSTRTPDGVRRGAQDARLPPVGALPLLAT